MRSFLRRFTITKIFLIIIILLLGWGAYRLWFKPSNPVYELVTAARGTIVQKVSVTGNTAPVKDINLAFENSGIITAANYNVGGHVKAGEVIARLNTSDLQAQLAQAEANVDSQAAKLRSLQAGSRPEDIQASQAALAKAKQDLINMYTNVSNVLADAYAKANDAVRNQLAPFFAGAETNNPTLTFSTTDSQTLNDIQFGRIQAGAELNLWQSELMGLTALSPISTLDIALQKGTTHLAVVKNLLILAAQTLTQTINLSASTANIYKTAVTAALAEVNSGVTGVSGAAQNIASQNITIQQLQAQLNLKLAGSPVEDIAAQQAQVEQAKASVRSIQAKIEKASLVSPLDGVITLQNAKAGEIATPGVTLVSIISDQGLEINAKIPEADIGKVKIGNAAAMTLDAFPGRTFTGKVSYIDPREKVVEGVPTYKTTFRFENMGSQVKPGMTANIDITADAHKNVIYIPQRAVASKDGKRTVSIYRGAGAALEERAVAVGLRDSNGNIEIVSGLTEGEVVVRSPK